MQKTASEVGVGDEFVSHKFLNSMSANIRPRFNNPVNSVFVTALCTLADELVSLTKPTPVCSQVNCANASSPHSFS